MISSVRGQVLAVHLDHAVIEVGGVGLAVRTTPATLAGLRRGEQATAVHHAGGPRGLADPVRLRHRRRPRICSSWCSRCPGSGPKIALALLAVLDPDQLRRALSAGDTATLTRAPGIGKKGAERLVLELKDKVGPTPGSTGAAGPAGVGVGLPWRDQLSDALVGLGFTAKQADDAAGAVAADTDDPAVADGDVGRAAAPRPGPAGPDPVSPPDDLGRRGRGPDARRRVRGGRRARPRCPATPTSRPRCGRGPSAEFVGQVRVREQLELVLSGAKLRGTPPDHVLLAGPPGLGKTSLSMIIAAELGAALRLTSGPALERAGDLAAILSNLVEGDVLFIDEIHRIARPAEEMLYLAMEDFRVDVMVGKGPGATSIPLEIAPFTLVGRDHQVRPADQPAAGPVRLHRAHGVLLGRRADHGDHPQRRHPRHRPAAGRRGRDRRPVPGHAADREPAAAPGPGLRAGEGGRHRSPGRSPGPPWRCTTSTSSAWTGWTGRC